LQQQLSRMIAMMMSQIQQLSKRPQRQLLFMFIRVLRIELKSKSALLIS
jgi:hypothetical protein